MLNVSGLKMTRRTPAAARRGAVEVAVGVGRLAGEGSDGGHGQARARASERGRESFSRCTSARIGSSPGHYMRILLAPATRRAQGGDARAIMGVTHDSKWKREDDRREPAGVETASNATRIQGDERPGPSSSTGPLEVVEILFRKRVLDQASAGSGHLAMPPGGRPGRHRRAARRRDLARFRRGLNVLRRFPPGEPLPFVRQHRGGTERASVRPTKA